MSKSDDVRKHDEIRKKQQTVPFILHGVFGATAGSIAMCVVQPMDLVKTRMQLLGRKGERYNMLLVFGDVIRKEGFRNLYKGLTCAILRQYTYGLTRFALFYSMLSYYEKKNFEPPNLAVKMCVGLVAGIGGGFMGNPADLALIRMTADYTLPPDKRRGYKHVFNALYRIFKEEGIKTWWRGVGATMSRCALVTAAELASYAQARQMIVPLVGDNMKAHFAASLIAGLACTTASLPSDIVKTRVQNSTARIGQIHALKAIVRKEGVLSLWSGFLPTYIKLGPHAIITFVIFEQMFLMYFKLTDPKMEPLRK